MERTKTIINYVFGIVVDKATGVTWLADKYGAAQLCLKKIYFLNAAEVAMELKMILNKAWYMIWLCFVFVFFLLPSDQCGAPH